MTAADIFRTGLVVVQDENAACMCLAGLLQIVYSSLYRFRHTFARFDANVQPPTGFMYMNLVCLYKTAWVEVQGTQTGCLGSFDLCAAINT